MSSVSRSQRFLNFLEACPVKRKTKETVEVALPLMFWSLRWLLQVQQQQLRLGNVFSQFASLAAWQAGASVYIFCLEGVFWVTCAFSQIVSILAAAASGYVFDQFASLAAAAWCACAFVYIFCIEGVFALGCVFLVWLLACGWFLDFGGHVLGLWIVNLCCVASTQHSRIGPLTGAKKQDDGRSGAGACGLLDAATSRLTSAAAAAALHIKDTLVFDEVQTSDLVTTTLSPSKGPRIAFQAKATPRVDVAEVPSVPSSQQALCVKSCFDHFPGSFGDDLVTPPSGLSFLLVTLSGKTLTMNEDPGILVSELLDKLAGLSALPTSAFYLTFGHICLDGADTLKSAGVQRDSVLRMRGRLLGGTARGNRNFQVPGSWHCSFCNMGGCWPGRDRCFRCNNPRFSNARRPPRESHFPGRPVQHGVSREPTVRVSRP